MAGENRTAVRWQSLSTRFPETVPPLRRVVAGCVAAERQTMSCDAVHTTARMPRHRHAGRHGTMSRRQVTG